MRAASPGALWRAVRAVGPRPDLWRVALSVAWRLAPRRWWRRWPPLPVPDARYWRFRMTTAYGGDGDTAPRATDVVEYLEWCRESRRARPARR
ncbi:MAG: hypothetical protein ACRDWE_13900 [Acidimicrobiales bacterium]